MKYNINFFDVSIKKSIQNELECFYFYKYICISKNEKNMYPEELVKPMRDELINAGFKALYSATDVENAIVKKGTTLVMVNSVCGCAAGTARPGAIASLRADKTPDNLTTVFAGVENNLRKKQENSWYHFLHLLQQLRYLKMEIWCTC